MFTMKLIYLTIITSLLFYVECHFKNIRQKLVIDHDGGADDAMAIFIALLHEKYFNGPEVTAITTTHGNVQESQTYENTQKILEVANRRDIPIYRGSKYPIIKDYPEDHYFGLDGLGENNVTYHSIKAQPAHAVSILIELSRKYKDKLIVVTLAPLTNIALAIRIDPDFIKRLKHLYVGAGYNNDAENMKPEFNALHDVEAYYIVAQNAYPDKVTVFSVIDAINIKKNWRVSVLGAINTDLMRAQNKFEEVSLTKGDKWGLLDPYVMSAALNSDVIGSSEYSNNSIILCGENRGANTNDFKSSKPNIKLVLTASENIYKEFLYNTFSANAKK